MFTAVNVIAVGELKTSYERKSSELYYRNNFSMLTIFISLTFYLVIP